MSIARYKNKPITPVDAVLWTGTNLEEVQTLCPGVTVPEPEIAPWILTIPDGFNLVVGEYLMKNVAGGTYTKLGADVFVGLYMPQPPAAKPAPE